MNKVSRTELLVDFYFFLKKKEEKKLRACLASFISKKIILKKFQLILFSCCFRVMLFMLLKILLKTDNFLWDRDPFNLRILYMHLGQSRCFHIGEIDFQSLCMYLLSPPHK